MRIYYKTPFIQEDGSVVLDQVTLIREGKMDNGILRRELKVIQELYPNLELLKETISLAAKNYENTALQQNKSVGQLEAEKAALKDLIIKINEME